MSQGPPVPAYIFRGHNSPIHALHFFGANTYLVSGDSDGWVVIWKLSTKRPVAAWKAHDGGVMGLKDWQTHKLISHGRDHKLRVWQLRPEDYEVLSITLPIDSAGVSDARQPWLLHSLSINALNYCAFSVCDGVVLDDTDRNSASSLLLAAPNGLDAGGIDIFQLPSEHRVCKLPSDKGLQTGMVMAVSLFRHPQTQRLALVSGYESGHVLLHVNEHGGDFQWNWKRLMTSQPHTQPVLSVDTTKNGEHAYSSSADATIGKFRITTCELEKKVGTKHAGQQGLQVRDDDKIFATAGWDKRVRVYSAKTVKELAVLKWHQEGCYATAFARTTIPTDEPGSEQAGAALIKSPLEILESQQAAKVQGIHWLAAGGKDGKISLWDIY